MFQGMTKKLEPGMRIEKTDFDYEVQVNLSMFNTK